MDTTTIKEIAEKLKPKTSLQASVTTNTGSFAATGAIVWWIYPTLRASVPALPEMTGEASWALTIILVGCINFIARMIPMRHRRFDDDNKPLNFDNERE